MEQLRPSSMTIADLNVKLFVRCSDLVLMTNKKLIKELKVMSVIYGPLHRGHETESEDPSNWTIGL